MTAFLRNYGTFATTSAILTAPSILSATPYVTLPSGAPTSASSLVNGTRAPKPLSRGVFTTDHLQPKVLPVLTVLPVLPTLAILPFLPIFPTLPIPPILLFPAAFDRYLQ